MRGIKLHPDFQRFNIDEAGMLEVYAACMRRGMVVLFHTGDDRTDFSSPRRLARVLEKLPDFVCIAAHLGGYREWADARAVLQGTNVYIDTSSSLFAVSAEDARRSIAHFGVDKTLFGTDFPMWTPKEELERFFALGYARCCTIILRGSFRCRIRVRRGRPALARVCPFLTGRRNAQLLALLSGFC